MEAAANEAKARINLSGAMDFIKKSKYPLMPLYQAITNSLEAMSQRDMPNDEEITITLNFTGLIDEVKELQSIEIVDNGPGFTSENYLRFQEFFDKSKGYDNKGTGRLQFLHRFEKLEVESVYEVEGGKRRRNFTCDAKHFIQNEKDEVCTAEEKVLSKIVLSNGTVDGKEKTFFDELTIDEVIKDIKRHFLLRFYLDAQKDELAPPRITVTFVKNGAEVDSQSLDSENMPNPQSTGDIKVPCLKIVDSKADKIEWKQVKDKDETIKWAHFKVPENELEKNDVYLCSKGLPIQALTFQQIKKNESVDGFRYLTAFYGDVLDMPENVSDTVDSFKFPDKKETETAAVEDLLFNADEEFLFFDSIKEQVSRVIPDIYKDIFDLHNEQEKDIESIARAHGIPIDVALKTKINLTDNERIITRKMYAEQSNGLAEKVFKPKSYMRA